MDGSTRRRQQTTHSPIPDPPPHPTPSKTNPNERQEAVKVLTQQYVPLNNTFVYNGLASVGGSYRL